MEDLTRDPRTGGKAFLVNSSMQGGNTTSNDPALSMTAPGSPSVLPMPDKADHLPLPEYSGAEIPVSHPGVRDKVAVHGGPAGGGAWKDAHDIPGPNQWKETS